MLSQKQWPMLQRWEFIKENKEVRKKQVFSFFSWSLVWSRERVFIFFLTIIFFSFFLGQERDFFLFLFFLVSFLVFFYKFPPQVWPSHVMGPRDGRREEVRVSRSREAPASKIYKVRTDGQISKDQSSGEKKTNPVIE